MAQMVLAGVASGMLFSNMKLHYVVKHWYFNGIMRARTGLPILRSHDDDAKNSSGIVRDTLDLGVNLESNRISYRLDSLVHGNKVDELE